MAQKTKSGWGPFAGRTHRPEAGSSGRQSSGAQQGASQGSTGGKRGKALLDAQARLLLAVNGLFAAASALSGTYVSVYLWKVKNDFSLIGWFTFFSHLTMALTFWIAGKWAKERNKMNVLRTGVAVSAVFYLLVLLLGTASASYAVLLGAVQGLANGLFWLAFNVVYFEVTDPDNRDRFNGYSGLLGSGAGILAPWLSGWLITRLGGETGYRLIFSLSLGVFVVGVVVSFFLRKKKLPGSYAWLQAFTSLKESGSSWRLALPALVSQGMREGVFGFIIGLLIFIATQSEMSLGNFSLITSAVGLVSFMLVGRFLKPEYRKWGMLIGVVMMVLVIVPFFWKLNYVTLLIFGVGVALFMPLYTVPMTSAVFDLIGSSEESAKLRVEYIVMRELGLNTGRMIGTLVFVAVISQSAAQQTVNWLLLGIGSSPIAAWLFMRRLLTPRVQKAE
ncbi:MFS transporter [Paenibacillus sp. y28]|uniref:MFS transporter n=1 Tax=Paenibacillus sp. y28 TaxID=3129110 RepID=UPI0030185209